MLGLTDAELSRHVGWDIGGLDSAIELSKALDAPLVASGYSRLVIDCNRWPHGEGSTPEISDTVHIPGNKGITKEQASARVDAFAAASRTIGGCGGAEKLAADFNGDVVQSDQVKLRELPAALQEMMMPMQIGQATRPFGNLEEGVRVLVMCGRDEVEDSLPSYDQVYSQLNEERVNMRARRYLRDLRRDAVIDFR